MAARYNPTLAMLYGREKQKGKANRATLAVAPKLVAYLMAVDRGQTHFLVIAGKRQPKGQHALNPEGTYRTFLPNASEELFAS